MLIRFCLLSLYLVMFLFNSQLKASAVVDQLTSQDIEVYSELKKKYNISVCALFKNEALFLKEWIEHHLKIGVEHFYLYNIGSKDHYEKVLKPYIKNKIVTLINWPEVFSYQEDQASKWALSTQIPAYENAVNFMAKDETQWLVFLDINEFLMLPKGDIKKILVDYEDFPGISFYSEYFDKGSCNAFSEKILDNENFSIDFSLDVMDKTVAKIIFKPDQCLGFSWPPYQCRFKESVTSIEADPQELRARRCINRIEPQIFSIKIQEPIEGKNHSAPSKDTKKDIKPIYHQTPEFLKKLKINLGIETLNPNEDTL